MLSWFRRLIGSENIEEDLSSTSSDSSIYSPTDPAVPSNTAEEQNKPQEAEAPCAWKKNQSVSISDLPPEIRIEIWRYVLGDQQLHIDFKSVYFHGKGRLINYECCRPIVPVLGIADPTAASQATSKGPITRHYLECCTVDRCRRRSIHGDRMQYSGGVEAAVLRTCRSMNLEAKDILYGTNRFTFESPEVLEAFVKQTTTINATSPTKQLHLNLVFMRDSIFGAQHWVRLLQSPALGGLERLTTNVINANNQPYLEMSFASIDADITAEAKALPITSAPVLIVSRGWFTAASNLSGSRLDPWPWSVAVEEALIRLAIQRIHQERMRATLARATAAVQRAEHLVAKYEQMTLQTRAKLEAAEARLGTYDRMNESDKKSD